MPPPPPPPPPALPGLPNNSTPKDFPAPAVAADRNALLSQIRSGAKLKKAVTNDRSAPLVVNGKTSQNSENVGTQDTPRSGGGGRSFSGSQNMLAGLFAQGMPKLKPTKNSFLQGGAYKSQLDPREMTKRRSMSKSSDDLGASNSPPNSSYAMGQGQEKQTPKVDVSMKAKSIQNLNNSCDTPNSLRKDSPNTQLDYRRQPGCPAPPPPSMKPSFGPSDKTFPVKSFLHNNDEIGGSEPNLNVSVKPKPRPLPEVPLRNVNGTGSVAKPTPVRKSYEDSDVPNNVLTSSKAESLAERSLKYSTLKNTSMPNNLNGRVFSNTESPSPVAPVRKFNRTSRPVKPSVAPPPAPVRAQASISGSSTLGRHSGALRAPPPPPPVTSPPPPPQRDQKYSMTINRNMKLFKDSPAKQDFTDSLKDFETRFRFKDVFEFPKPDSFSSKPKTYPSRIAKSQSRKKMCQAPPNPPPPPPPINYSRA